MEQISDGKKLREGEHPGHSLMSLIKAKWAENHAVKVNKEDGSTEYGSADVLETFTKF